jgi:Uncharacterized vancomycin resistance protein
MLIGFALGFVLCLGLAGGGLFAYDANHDGRVLSGVVVGGVDLSGLDREQGVAALHAAFDGYADGRVVVRTAAGDVVVPYEAFSRRADVEAMVDEAMLAGRSGTLLERAVAVVRLGLSGQSLARLALDPAALAAEVQAAVARLDRTPSDGGVTMGATGVVITPAQTGRSFDGTAAAAAALEVVRRTDAPAEVVVEVAPTGVPPEHGDVEALAAKVAADRMTRNVVVTLGSKKWTIKAATVRSWLTFRTRADGSAWPVADQAAIAGALTSVAKAVRVAPVSATFLKARGGRIVGVVAGKDGRQLDPTATAAAIAQALAERGDGAQVVPVAVAVAKVPPKFSTAEALKKAPLMQRLGTWSTWFPVSDRNYFGANIWLPAKIIDGTVLSPGQTFEWWGAIGPVTPGRGFGPGGFIAGDHTEPTGALGGGMCSSSTTLFNAALRAGLQMGDRSNHKYYIYRYPLGLDATVSKTRGGSQTVTFTNDMHDPIVIRTFRYTAGGRGWVRYEIWGIPDGRKTSIGKAVVSNLLKATTQTVYVSTLKRGVRMQVEYPANGMDVAVTRVVSDAHGKVIHRDTYRTHYVLWNGRIEIGS